MGVKGIFMYVCGSFIGYFKDPHVSPPSSDNGSDVDSEEERMKPKHHYQLKSKKADMGMHLGKDVGLDMGAVKGWLPYMTTVTIETKVGGEVTSLNCDAVRAHSKLISPAMLDKLNGMKLHTIDIIHCHIRNMPQGLQEIENLRIIRVSHNDIQMLTNDAGKESDKPSKVEQIHIDHNCLTFIERNALSDEAVAGLEVLNMRSNKMCLFPQDFLQNAHRLRLLDLSYNQIRELPDAVVTCAQLQLLILSHNQLMKLPEHIDRLENLRKLFVSYNALKTLPDSIGQCVKLEKIRIISNHVRLMPFSIINLWKERDGNLEELQVDNNPLVQPSITAFEMGGITQAFRLFAEWIEEQQMLKKRGDALALQDNVAAIEDARGGGNNKGRADGDEEGDDENQALTDGRVDPGAATESTNRAGGGVVAPAGGDAGVPEHEEEDVDNDGGDPGEEEAEAGGLPSKYYFSHLAASDGRIDPIAVAEIRGAESALLLLKKNSTIQRLKHEAQAKLETCRNKDEVPEHLKQFLEPSFNVSSYNKKIHVTDLDLYFYLLVYSTKPMFSTCEALFDKFESARRDPDRYLMREEWDNLCARVPVKLPDEVQQQMWDLLAWRKPGELPLDNFIAGWHIHDIEERDSWIKRVSTVLRLDYYEMDLGEMQDRLAAKSAEHAEPQLDFDHDDDSDTNEARVDLPLMEGERRLAVNTNHGEEEDMAAQGPKFRLSLNDVQYASARKEMADDSGSEGEVSELSIESDALSKASDTSQSDFEAQTVLGEAEELEKKMLAARQLEQADASRVKFNITSDRDLAHLMDLPPAEIWFQPEGRLQQDDGTIKKKKDKVPRLVNTEDVRDPRFRTDVFTVRCAIREAYRSMPFDDFFKMINFVLRGLRLMKHYNPSERVTYWHREDPTFTHTIATNVYAQQLLREMGFVLVLEYWIWPEKHMNFKNKKEVWGSRAVPKHCPGLDKQRLDDMVILLKDCQQNLVNAGKTFQGHISKKQGP